MAQQSNTNLSEIIAENFGANATYVETLLARWRSDPSLVDESWRAYFEELAGANGDPATSVSGTTPARPGVIDGDHATASSAAPAPAKVATRRPETAPEPAARPDATPIRGAALKIVENMEASLAVPTATSQRRIPVKLLEENRRIINRHLADRDHGKASFTHLIAYAVLRALEEFPQMNDGFDVLDEQPVRLKRVPVNMGIAIDLEKKDGTRSLLVPNIKNATALSFPEFLKTYNDIVSRARAGKLQISDFQGTTISLTNPGTIGTVPAFDGRTVRDHCHGRD